MPASRHKFLFFGTILLLCSMAPDILLARDNNYYSLKTFSEDEIIIADNYGDSTRIVTDSTKIITDSTKNIRDTSAMAARDTFPASNIPMANHGSTFIIDEGKPYQTIQKYDFLYIQYIGLHDIIRSKTPAYPLSLGSFGQFSGFSFFGGSPTGVDVSFNNRSLNDISYGSYNVEQFSPEFLEQIDVLTGTDAVVLHDNSTGAAINLQEIKYNTSKPYSRIFFTEAANNHITGDGVFSKNFMQNLNFTFGFRALSGNGRNSNSYVDSWHVRGLLRWNPSDRMSLSLTENYTNHNLGLSGGIAGSDPFSDSVNVSVTYPTLIEKNFRHDLALTFSYIADEDSINSFFVSSSLTNSEWEHSSKDIDFDRDTNEGFHSKYITEKYGVTGFYNFNVNFFNLKLGCNFDYIKSGESILIEGFDGQSSSLFAHGKLNLFDYINLSFGARYRQMKDKTAFSYGVKSEFTLSKEFGINCDLSMSDRLPTFTEGFKLDKETHILALAEIVWSLKNLDLRLGAFYRRINNPILTSPVIGLDQLIYSTESTNHDNRNIFGATAMVNYIPLTEISFVGWKLTPVNLDINLQYYYSETDNSQDRHLPQLYGSVKLFTRFAVSESIANVGLSFEFISNYKGESFYPLARLYLPADVEQKFMHNGVSVFVTTKLGDAYLRLSLNNILYPKLYYVPSYPIYDNYFLLQVAWAFFD